MYQLMPNEEAQGDAGEDKTPRDDMRKKRDLIVMWETPNGV